MMSKSPTDNGVSEPRKEGWKGLASQLSPALIASFAPRSSRLISAT
jgi:hypothetical protein